MVTVALQKKKSAQVQVIFVKQHTPREALNVVDNNAENNGLDCDGPPGIILDDVSLLYKLGYRHMLQSKFKH
jgi:hypothetical protein